MSLSKILPKPSLATYDPDVQQQYRKQQELKQNGGVSGSQLVKSGPPPYGHRKGWVPRSQADFGDGGAYPECIVVQYPMMMGSKKKGAAQSNAVALQYDKDGSVKYDAILKTGHREDKIIHSGVESTLYKQYSETDLQRPDEDEIKSTTESTRAALEKLVNSKISAALPVRAAPKQEPAQYIRFTPAQQGGEFNSGAKQRIIRMVEMQVDPMEPPKFNTSKKIPRGPPSPPVPVLHSPTRKLTAKEQQDWKIPPCVSNWKNAKGYTIPLDKRLAADGRGLQSVTINENFARLAEALFIADRKAREAVEMRAQVERKMATKEKEKQENKLRALAAKARMERAGISAEDDDAEMNNDDERGAINERNEIREERRKDRARERNIARAAPDKQAQLRKDGDRDVSEQIALGLPTRANQNDESMFDQRLFNKSQGLDSGFGFDDDTYNIFDKPFRNEANLASNIYRPSKNIDQDTYGDDLEKLKSSKRFVPDKDFAGGAAQSSREGPVQFEMAPGDEGGEEEDPFGLEKFLSEAKKGSGGASGQTSSGSASNPGMSMAGTKRPKTEMSGPDKAASSSSSKRKR